MAYELWIDSGVTNSAFTKVQTFADAGGEQANLLEHSLTVAGDSLVVGRIYSFKFRSANSVGWSEFSSLLRVGLGDQVQAPTGLEADLELATATSLSLKWNMVEDDELVT